VRQVFPTCLFSFCYFTALTKLDCSTIGPICSTNLGMRTRPRVALPSIITPHACHVTSRHVTYDTLSAGTVDVGVPQLSMHSIREMCGVDDVLNCKLLAHHFLADFRELDQNFGQ
jgi:hypothetical protein